MIHAILNKLAIVILVTILTGSVAFIYSRYFVKPQYVATTQVYILSKQDPTQKTLTTNDLTFATYLANDYQVLLTSEPVLQEVKRELDLDMTTADIAAMISVELKEDTRIMDISVINTSPKLAKEIADKVRDVANEKTKDVMEGIEAVNPIDEAKLPTAPASPNIKKYTLLGSFLGFAVTVIIISIMFILDDTIKTPEDIEKKLEVSVLASIPLKNPETESKRKKRKSSRHSKKKKRITMEL